MIMILLVIVFAQLIASVECSPPQQRILASTTDDLICKFRYQLPRPLDLDRLIDHRHWYFYAATEEAYLLRLERIYAANQSFVQFDRSPDIEGMLSMRAEWYQPQLRFLRVLRRIWSAAANHYSTVNVSDSLKNSNNNNGSAGGERNGEFRRTIGQDGFVVYIRVFNDLIPPSTSGRGDREVDYLIVTECLAENSRLTMWLLGSKPLRSEGDLLMAKQLVERFQLMHRPHYPMEFYPYIIYPVLF
jgi:hypothetical protein